MSRADEIAARDERARAAVTARRCPSCGEYLVPRVPLDPSAVFDADGVRYEGHCRVHGPVT